MTTRTLDPLGVTTGLPADLHACRTCGVPTDTRADEVPVIDGELDDEQPRRVRVRLATCPDCAHREETAAAITRACMPGILRHGAPGIIAPRLVRALIALDVVRQPIPPAATWTTGMVISALDRLEEVGGQATWAAHGTYAARANAAASEPWLFVDSDHRARIRREVAEWIVDQRDPHPVPHPTGSGCAACGISTSMGRRKTEAWHFLTSGTHRGALLCAVCVRAYRPAETYAALINRAMADHLDPDGTLRRKLFDPPTFKSITMWADDPRRKPSTRPWAHVNTTSIQRDLEIGNW